MKGGIARSLRLVEEQLSGACARAQRKRSDVTLVAVSKGHPASAVREAYEAGQREFGENYAQELRDKAAELSDLEGLRWHFLGPLQTNKLKYVVGTAAVMHSVDRVALAQALHEKLKARAGSLDVLLEVNTGGEAQKHGFSPDGLAAAVAEIGVLDALRLRGLMCIPPYREDPEDNRQDFAMLRALARNHGLTWLSMGMSADFQVAIEEGATLVRIGTAIFGERPARK